MGHGSPSEQSAAHPVEVPDVSRRAHDPETVSDMLLRLAHRHDRGPTFVDEQLTPHTATFADVVQRAKAHAAFLGAHGVRPGDRVALILGQAENFMPAFFGAVLAGAAPVPMPMPVSARAFASSVESWQRILRAAECQMILTSRALSLLAGPHLTGLLKRQALFIEDVPSSVDAAFQPHRASPNDVCFLQFTSGSTSEPKGVVVSHGNLVANSRAIMHGWLNATADDLGVSWLPLYHDMGLIGFMIAPLLTASPMVFLPTLAFIQRPSIWMQAVSTFRATITVSPNFGLALATRRPGALDQLDLSCLRVIGCGAEPIHAETLAAFEACHGRAGLRDHVISPLYGLAEATLLATSVSPERPRRVIEIDRRIYEEQRRVEPCSTPDTGMRLVGCGAPPHGHEVCIVADDGTPLPEGRVGEIVLRGPSCTPGYFRHPPAEVPLKTGDLGFILEGELFISGRTKEMFIVNGRNIYPQSVEWEVEQVPNVRRGSVVVFGAPADAQNTEAVVVLAEVTAGDRAANETAIRKRVVEVMNLPVRAVEVVPKGSIPKTSSGKLKRVAARALWEQGAFPPQ